MMTDEQIKQAFEGRWRIKGNYGQMNKNSALMSFDEFFESIKDLCRDFFTAGVIIAERSVTCANLQTIKTEYPITPEEAVNMQIHIMNQPTDSTKSAFDMWWDMYDLKCNRAGCEKKWNKMTAAEKYACVAATPAYVASTPDKQYRKRPLTFLNQKAWQDEIIIRQTRDQQRQQRIAESANLVAKYAGADKGTD